MRTMTKKLLSAALLGSIALVANAAPDRLVTKHLDFRDLHLQGGSTIKLKQELNDRYPRLNLRDAIITSVEVIAKSRQGNATAALEVAGIRSYPETIDGNPRLFDGPRGFSQIYLRNPAPRMDGPWQLELRGNIKLRTIAVTLRTRDVVQPYPTPRPFPQSRMSANCKVDTGGNFFKPKTKVLCTVIGQGAVSYKVLVDGHTQWLGNLRPGLNRQSFQTSEKKLVLNWQPDIQVIVTTANGRQHRVY